MKIRFLMLIILALILSLGAGTASAQLGGEELPPGVTHDEVYDVASQMYCDVCAGVPLSTCASVTCRAWRQEIATLLGEGNSPDEIYEYFSVRYGDDVTGVPLENDQKAFALGLPAALTLILGLLVVWQVSRMRAKGETRAQQAARSAGLLQDFERPVPDNVDPEGLRLFLKRLEERG